MATTEVTSGVIKDASITAAKMAANSVDSASYVDGSIDPEHLADNAVTLAKMASGTDGNIISFDSSGNPVAIATGNDGQVLTSAGAGAQPAFEDAGGGGAWTLISLTNPSSAASVALTGFDPDTYASYVIIYDIVGATDNVRLHMRTSTDGGSSFDSGAGSYSYAGKSGSHAGGTGDNSSTGATEIQITNNTCGNATGEGSAGTIIIYFPDKTTNTKITWEEMHITDGGYGDGTTGSAHRKSNADVDGAQLFFASGNIASGSVALYGIKKS